MAVDQLQLQAPQVPPVPPVPPVAEVAEPEPSNIQE